jgi:hypothetical protein
MLPRRKVFVGTRAEETTVRWVGKDLGRVAKSGTFRLLMWPSGAWRDPVDRAFCLTLATPRALRHMSVIGHHQEPLWCVGAGYAGGSDNVCTSDLKNLSTTL